MSKPNEKIQFMADVAQDIINMKVGVDTTLRDSYNEFLAIMDKHGIKQGTKEKVGVSMNNTEWVMCLSLFKQRFHMDIDVELLLIDFEGEVSHY